MSDNVAHPALEPITLDFWMNQLMFGAFPYIALSVFIIGSIVRFDREQYSWRTGSSQLLRRKQLMWGSNLFHLGILFLLLGHTVGLLTPHSIYSHVITAEAKQLLAIVAGSIAGVVCLVGLVILMHRRFLDPRIRRTSTFSDNAILVILFVQLVLGLVTVPFSLSHADASVMLRLSSWAQGILTFQPGVAHYVKGLDWPYQVHLLLGMTIFLLFPFTRLVHMLSAPIWYLNRKGWQVVRTARPDMTPPSEIPTSIPSEQFR
ncbi:respiratory nitrate reductase subunit gamma [Sandaracinobacteroides sp. A072]|uniref:respiratory nitrate reductase subunit gamma n=1 Tax=Sandaracinobacteroides sp. A072 TaxID=3461146 RepID=UPI0040418DAC